MSASKPKASAQTLLYFARTYLRPYRREMLYMALALLVSSGSMLTMGWVVRHLVDSGLQSATGLAQAMVMALGLSVLMALGAYGRFTFIAGISERVVRDLRSALFQHLLVLSPAFYERTRVGEVISRVTTDTNELQWMVGSSISMVLRHSVLLVGGLALVVYTNPWLAAYIAVAMPLVFTPMLWLGRKVRRLSKAAQDSVADLGAQVEETLHGLRTVQAYTQETARLNYFQQLLEAGFGISQQRIRARALLLALVILLTFGALVGLIWLGGMQVLRGQTTPGDLASFLFYALVVAGSVANLSEVWGDVQRATGALEGIFQLLRTPLDITDGADAAPLVLHAPPRIQLQHVTFHYPSKPETAALEDVSLTVEAGQTVALVGHSGAGKSTIFQLLLRFYDVENGIITINDAALRQTRLRDWRAPFAYVSQDPVLFSTTVRQNVQMANVTVDDAAVWAALRAAQAEALVKALPQGLDTYIGEKGVRLSGGEKQRIALARALLHQPKILLLDEATSALDGDNEHAVHAAIASLAGRCTTLIIAHRLSTVQHADVIIVMEHGRIVAQGSHAELLVSSPLYQQLAQRQFVTSEV